MKLLVRDVTVGGSFEERDGNLSVGGIYFSKGHPPIGNTVEVRFIIPGTRTEIRTAGEIVKVDRQRGAFGAHVRFADMPVQDELAIARFFDEK